MVSGEKLKILMCVLASGRNFRFLCFVGVAPVSIGSALSIRSGLDHLYFVSEGYANLRGWDMSWGDSSGAATRSEKSKTSGLKT